MVYTQAQTSRSSDPTIFRNGGQLQMSHTTNHPPSEARHVRAARQSLQRAHDPHEPLRRPTMERQHRSANLAGLHVDDAISRRRKSKMKTTTRQTTSTFLRHQRRLVQRMQSQQSVV
jgi:hypothetical protein